MEVEVAEKTEMFVQAEGGGVRKEAVAEPRWKERALSDEQAVAIARVVWAVEGELGRPQDFEWAIEGGEQRQLPATWKPRVSNVPRSSTVLVTMLNMPVGGKWGCASRRERRLT